MSDISEISENLGSGLLVSKAEKILASLPTDKDLSRRVTKNYHKYQEYLLKHPEYKLPGLSRADPCDKVHLSSSEYIF